MGAVAAKRKPRQRAATVLAVNAMREPGRHSVGDSLILVVSPAGARAAGWREFAIQWASGETTAWAPILT
jgi:hypothetical protein